MGRLAKVLREIEWRTSEPGMPLTDADRQYIKDHGLRPVPGMKAWDFCVAMNHILNVTCGKTLSSFKMPAPLRPLRHEDSPTGNPNNAPSSPILATIPPLHPPSEAGELGGCFD